MKKLFSNIHNGFILPAIILLGLGVSIVSATFVQYIVSSSGSLNAQSYNIIAEEAAYSGISYAISCIAAASSGWTSLVPNSTCSGATDSSRPSLSSAPSGEWSSSFRVNAYTPTNKKVSATGIVTLSSGVQITATRNITISNALRQVPVPSPVDNVVTDISTDSHSCAIANGQLYCWGDNSNGQLGDGTTNNRHTPTRVTTFNGMMVTKVAVGTRNTCAIADGQLYCWGNNANGQLGIGSTGGNRTTPQVVLKPAILPDFKVTDVAISQSSPAQQTVCAIANGITFCWGDNSDGQVGQYYRTSIFSYTPDTTDRTQPTPVWGYRPGDSSTFAKLYGKKSTSVGVGFSQGCNTADGVFHCWGDTIASDLRLVNDYTNGDYASEPLAQPWSARVVDQGFCTVNDNLVCRGSGTFASNGGRIFSTNPDIVSSFPVKGITDYDSDEWTSGSDGVLCAVVGGWTWCRGHRDYVGTLGIFGTAVRNPMNPTRTGLKSTTKVGVGERYGCLVINGGLACWGNTTKGQLADGLMSSNKSNPEIVGYPTIGVSQDTLTWQHDFVATGPLGVGNGFSCTTANAVLFCWGENDSNGRLGLGTNDTSQEGQPTMTDPSNVLNFEIENPSDPTDKFTAPYTAVERISSSDSHSCMITATLKNPALYCWGQNTYGQLGTGDVASKNKPTAVRTYDLAVAPKSWLSTRTVTEVSTGPKNTCAIADSRLYCWGDRSTGIVPVTSTSGTERYPVIVTAFESKDYQVTDVSVGDDHACAVVNGDAYCWGNNTDCATGGSSCTGTKSIYCDVFTSCSARRTDTKVTSGSLNTNYGNLTGAAVTKISAGNRFTCAIVNGSVSCWGRNNRGQAGVGSTLTVTQPTAISTVGSYQAETISAGYDHACAVLQGRVYCWGDNTAGKLGDGSTTMRTSPVLINGGSMVNRATINVVAGRDGTCSVSNGAVLCWGAGLSGQIGDNGWSDRTTPTVISGYRMSGNCGGFNCSGPLY